MRLDDLGFVGRGKSKHRPRNDPSLYGGSYPFVQTGDIKDADLWVTHYTQTYNEKGLAQSKLWPVGTLCITIAANIAETAILKIPACFPDSIVGFVPHPGRADARFIKYYIYTIKSGMQNVSKGTTQDNLSLDKLLSFDFQVPDYQTQQRVASVLSAYDDLINNNNRRMKILEGMAKMIYREWFVNYRFPGHKKVHMVDSETRQIPAGWKSEPLESVCQRITDGSHWSPKGTAEGLPMASVKDMHTWGLDLSGCRKISNEDFEALTRNDCKPLAGDVLIAKDGSYLKHCFWVQKTTEVVILSSIAILRPNKKIRPSYLSLHLLDPQIKSRMAGYVSGVAVPRIVLNDFRKFSVLVPPQPLQDTFSHLVEPMLQLCRSMTEQNSVLRQTRDLLLPKLISGVIKVDHAEREAVAQGA